MTTEKKWFGDLLFGFQVIMAWVFTIPQTYKAFSHQGTITWALFCFMYVLISLPLAIGGYKEKRSRKSWQVMMIYINFVILWFSFLTVSVLCLSWSVKDSEISCLILLGVSLILFFRKKESFMLTIADPVTKGWLSFGIKSTLQLYVGYLIISTKSSSMLAMTSMVVGHITVSTRIIEVYLTASDDGWSPNKKGLFWSELGNELTWCLTTLAWFMF